MKIDQVKNLVKDFVENEVKIPILLVGPMGIGKSHIFKQVCMEQHIGYVDLRLAQMEAGDIVGLPYRDGASQKWSKPEWWPFGARGIIVLEELNRAPIDVRQAVFQLLNERRINTHVLPEGWFIMAAINPDNGEYQVESLDKAMLRRFLVLAAETDFNVWKSWAKDKIHNKIISFLDRNPQLLFKPEKIEIHLEYNPDGYRMLNEIIDKCPMERYSEDTKFEIMKGLLGNECALAMIKDFRDQERFIKADELFKDYSKLKNEFLNQSNDKLFQTMEDIIDYCKTVKISKDFAGVFMDIITNIPKEYQSKFVYSCTDGEWGDKFISDLKKTCPKSQEILLGLAQKLEACLAVCSAFLESYLS